MVQAGSAGRHEPPLRSEAAESASRLHAAVALRRLVGQSSGLEDVKRQVLLAAKSDVTVLVAGETGTGKELVAQAIHYLSDRAPRPFIPVNCSAIPPTLFENELFGHRPGAFTDARSREVGLLAEAERGTLFLDELDSLPHSAQAKLLRLLEDRSYRPLGSARSLTSDVRLVAATNAELQDKIAEGAFRRDLYYRVSVIQIALPPLRERGDDVRLLAEHFLREYGTDRRWQFSSAAIRALLAHTWPGNVREVENLIRRLVIMTPPGIVRPEDLMLPAPPETQPAAERSFRAARAAAIERFERAYLEQLLRAHHGNISSAARAAEQDRSSFRRLLKRYGLNGQRPGFAMA